MTVDLVCDWCGTPFARTPAERRTVCSRRCRNARAKSQKSPEDIAAARRRYRAKHPEKFGWNDAKKASYHRRRARKKGSAAERVVAAEVFARDEWTCGICCELVDRELAYPDPKSASLDHVVPLSKGGAHSIDNVQLAHLGCNVAKGAQIEVAA